MLFCDFNQQRVNRTFNLLSVCDVIRRRRAPASVLIRLKKGLCLKVYLNSLIGFKVLKATHNELCIIKCNIALSNIY